MSTTLQKAALAALCATALCGITSVAGAATLTISGAPLAVAPDPLYGTSQGQNNVVNATGVPTTASSLFDPTGPNFVAATTPWIQGGAVVATGAYAVSWFYAGSESGFNISFNSPGLAPAGPFPETNLNNNLGVINGTTNPGPQFMGNNTSVLFTLSWFDGAVNKSQGNDGVTAANIPGSAAASNDGSIVYSWLVPDGAGGFNLTRTAQDCTTECWFAFALNDNGAKTATGTDDNHDDFVGFARFLNRGEENSPTPIPGALPLFATVLGGGLLARKLRNRRKQPAA
jgi:hypothetical protein